jgi:hypothetical protein
MPRSLLPRGTIAFGRVIVPARTVEQLRCGILTRHYVRNRPDFNHADYVPQLLGNHIGSPWVAQGHRRTEDVMEHEVNVNWNCYHVIGPKLPLKPKEIWGVRIRSQMACRVRDLALFDLGLDSKLRACDLVKIWIGDATIGRSIRSRCMVIQQKTGRPVQFEITGACKESLIAWLEQRGVRNDDWIFPSRSNRGGHLTTRQYGRLVDQ